ncbi:hypothetical protein [Azospirillum sp. B2RO_4]|uniref:hypothetical protein n=1 Tax=Azospirillum sp. B2RO_4 TaxID=3027796 RepID=UPI003DA9C617
MDAGIKLTLDLSGLLQGPGAGAPLSDLVHFQHKLDGMTNLLVLVVIAGAGVLVLWAGRSNWRSTVDMVQALLAGVGTRVTVGLVSQRA